MLRSDIKRLAFNAAQSRLAARRPQTYAALAALPARRSETVPRTKGVISTYRDEIGASRLRIVVQGVLRGWLGSAFICADGFTIEPDGAVVPLTEKALWDFT
jgi:hypothetical protein